MYFISNMSSIYNRVIIKQIYIYYIYMLVYKHLFSKNTSAQIDE